MTSSSFLSKVTMNGSVGDDHHHHHHTGSSGTFHHLGREFSNLSMLNHLGDRNNRCINSSINSEMFSPNTEPTFHVNKVQQENLYSSSNNQAMVNGGDNIINTNSSSGNHLIEPAFEDLSIHEFCSNKSLNMTETVAVPSSEHVAEIVGRQGCKIKSLRTQTNTYIKTPVRGAEPVFVVTGRIMDVSKAKHQILSAAEHFSSIRASRRNGVVGPQASTNSGTSSPTSVPGHVTSQVQVPYKLVGLVVGPKGATIKRIQQTTSTYIVTPGRDKEPIFDVTGLPENVEKAKEEIEKHIASRTGTDNNSDLQIDDFQVNGIDSGYHDLSGESPSANASTSSYHYGNNIVNRHDNLPPLSSLSGVNGGPASLYVPANASSSHHHQPTANAVSSSMKISEFNVHAQQFNHFNQTSTFKAANPDYDIDEGFGTSGSAASATSVYDPSALWNDATAYGVQRSNSVSVSARILPPGEDGPHPRTRRTNSDPLAAAFQKIDAAFSSSSPTNSQGSTSPVTGRCNPLPQDNCKVCQVKEAEAGFVTCGHMDFCLNCAQDICQRELARRKCPICKQVPNGALLMRSSN